MKTDASGFPENVRRPGIPNPDLIVRKNQVLARMKTTGGWIEKVFADVSCLCNWLSDATIERVRELDYVLTPGRYVGLPDDEDDFNFKERFIQLKAEFEEQLQEEAPLNKRILESLSKVCANK